MPRKTHQHEGAATASTDFVDEQIMWIDFQDKAKAMVEGGRVVVADCPILNEMYRR